VQVFKVSDGENFASYDLNLEEKVLTVGGISIDLESEVQDCQTLITITRTKDGDFVRGLDGKAGYVADIEIPPREYRFEETGEGADIATERTALPLDLNVVILRLWPFGTGKTMQEEG
jgi:hypothetical protein